MLKNKQVSVIVPVYNKEKYLNRCLESLLNQTYTNLEIILVDDGSTDGSLVVCQEYAKKDSRIKVLAKKNGGVSSARNCGLEHSTGEWIAFVDPDDWLNLQYFELLMESAEQYHAEIVCCFANDIYEKNNTVRTCSHETGNVFVTPKSQLNWLDVKHNHDVIWGAIYKKYILQGLEFNQDLTVGEDTLFFAQAADKAQTIVKIDRALYNYSRNEDSVTVGKWNMSKLSDLEARQRIKQLFKKEPKLYYTARAGCALVSMSIAARYSTSKEFVKEGLPYCKAAFRKDAKCLLKEWARQKKIFGLCKASIFFALPRVYVWVYCVKQNIEKWRK